MNDTIELRYTYHDAEKDKHYVVELRIQGFEVVMEIDEEDNYTHEHPAPIEKQPDGIKRLADAFNKMMVEFWK